MADWENLKSFAALARNGTLSAAARLLAVEHATIARRIAALEQELGLRLVDRRGRQLLLTAAGKRVASLVGPMDAQAQAIERTASGERAEVSGEVTISATPVLAATMLAEPIVDLRRSHPRLTIRVLAETRYSSLNQREADIAVRFSRPIEGDLTASKVGAVTFHLYGSRAYLETTSASDWTFIGYDEVLEGAAQQAALRRVAGDKPLALRSSTLELQVALVRAGGGVAALPDFIAARDPVLARARREKIAQRDVWLVFHTDLKRSAPVRTVATCLREFLREKLAATAR
ncbi:LysR family transcriptional regulator [Bradyrhizobium pachyrhizi]|uniref:LysR family transcriptional regulator n=1 Tax=Bradyrhizobium pachyrhizi TaxID=280333 RepID=A0A844STR7_9BRAD|nr:LysR family transcriptional regulator [Bradyrhizobium pachyrhizi]MVT70463.1 LysR family transcriptional regulator [Bradyrhizobium pachyrhizi]WFU55206.1 LysR family transcriptional regulator [Bradyrhizobium pachyrhizi]